MKRLIVVLALAVAVLIAVLWWRSRSDPGTARTAAADRPVAAPRLVPGGGGRPGRLPVGARDLPPPPADFNPGETTTTPNRTDKLRKGEFPLLPPSFDDPAMRAAFRAWWEREYQRRAKIYTDHNPGDYPSDEELAKMLDHFYDDGEPPRSGENPDDYDERRQRWFETWRDLTAAYGTPPKTVLSFGGDPQFGDPEPPPVVPDGAGSPQPDPTRPTRPADSIPDDGATLGPARPR